MYFLTPTPSAVTFNLKQLAYKLAFDVFFQIHWMSYAKNVDNNSWDYIKIYNVYRQLLDTTDENLKEFQSNSYIKLTTVSTISFNNRKCSFKMNLILVLIIKLI